MRPPELRIHADELVIDSFAGGGGASTGLEWAIGRSPDIAVNHDPEAIAVHEANHPNTRHFCEDVWKVDPKVACGGRKVGLAWFSPDCKHFSRAKGGKPVEKKIRGLAWVVIRWAKAVKPRIILLENVSEFQDWGPLNDDDTPDKTRLGFTFRQWLGKLTACGYHVELRKLKACDFGAPTTRERLFVIARSDGRPIVWPQPTHGPGRLPYRVAAECMDFAQPTPSIFERRKSLAEKTLQRIGRGLRKFVIEREPFIIPFTHHGDRRHHPLSEPFPVITAAHRGELGLIAPTLIQTGYGERPGQLPRIFDLQKPHPTVVGGGAKTALVAAFIARHYGGPRPVDGADLQMALPTVTATDHHSLVTSHLLKLKGTCKDGQRITEPMPTVQAMGTHLAEVRAFLIAYFGNEKDGGQLDLPMRTVTTKDRFGLVTVHGQDYEIGDIGMRMLIPRELFNAQGFRPEYKIAIPFHGKTLSKTAQTRLAGNSVCPDIAAALARAQLSDNPVGIESGAA